MIDMVNLKMSSKSGQPLAINWEAVVFFCRSSRDRSPGSLVLFLAGSRSCYLSPLANR